MTTVLVGNDYDAWIDKRLTRVSGKECSGCWEAPAIASDGSNNYCEACLRYIFGYSQTEEKMVRSIVGAAAAAARDAGASEELVRLAVEDAFTDQVRVETEWRV